MELKLHALSLPLRHPFRVAHGVRETQENLIVELVDGDHRGFGEAAAIPYYNVTQDSMSASLEKARHAIESAAWDRPEALWEQIHPLMRDDLFALAALDEAAHDLWGQREGKAVHALWGLDVSAIPLSDYTIGIDTIPTMVAKMQEFAGWPIYKIKLGTDEDLAIVRELRQHTDAVFRIDANTAWTAEQTIELSGPLKELGVEFLEQPLKADDWAGMERVKAACALPVIADESCIIASDVERCAGVFDGVNVKLLKAGGMTPAKRMLERARELGLKTMVGCMTETSVGIAAIAQLLPLLDYVDMDGALLLGRDPAEGVTIERGVVTLPDRPGNGVIWHG
ncbi:dipeptide epimerase [Mucisphaera calidilacus]|uniref:Dipeptide epimerase n=1 Tax=Mucisphaera calidilacus TaxID=2527982 RepID=A0A518BUP9_9BACT|nr:dipeptide epimerase [Mucisphaera calidilacus]QDU70712.1 L-Ala-D/L-Glu epimerase [Mucisphaera calidilacus]